VLSGSCSISVYIRQVLLPRRSSFSRSARQRWLSAVASAGSAPVPIHVHHARQLHRAALLGIARRHGAERIFRTSRPCRRLPASRRARSEGSAASRQAMDTMSEGVNSALTPFRQCVFHRGHGHSRNRGRMVHGRILGRTPASAPADVSRCRRSAIGGIVIPHGRGSPKRPPLADNRRENLTNETIATVRNRQEGQQCEI
jgi:hypothetical protein